MKIREVLNIELERIVLTTEDIFILDKLAKEFIFLLKKNGLKAFVGGSLAKGTMIKKTGKQDIDVFVVFDYSDDIFKLEGILKKIKLPGVLKKVHGSRDYFQVDCKEVLFEVIPVVRNEDPELAENVTDVSLSHVVYVKSKIEKNPKLADEIRLAKSFCQANRFYGAESYVKGFSGYSLEVLVIYFGSFEKFLKGIGKKRVIDPLKQFKSDLEVLREINSSKIQGPLVLVDPTFKYRNVLAGLGFETFEKFKEVAKSFLKSPSLEFFKKKEVDISNLKNLALKKKACFVELELSTDRQEGDIAGTKMKKFFDFFIRELERKKQEVIEKVFDYSGKGKKAYGYLVVRELKEIEVRGPHADLTDAVRGFRKSRKVGIYKKGKYLWFKEKISIKGIFEKAKRVSLEMGASAKLVMLK